MIQELIDKAKRTLSQKEKSFQQEQARLRVEESVLSRLRTLEERVASGQGAFAQFKADFDLFCSGDTDVGGWFCGELSKATGGGAAVYSALLCQVAANDAAKAHREDILAGCSRVWVEGPEADMTAFKKENAAIMKKYGVSV